jgi:DNA-binding transcriptional MerR regulator
MSNDFQDVDFENIETSQNSIRGKALYYSTSQVASILDTSDSKIRYYTSVFEDILHIEISNKQRRYVNEDIEKLKFIIELKNQGMTIKQIQEYCMEVDFDMNNGIQIKESNPLSIQTLAQALMEEQSKQLDEFKTDVISLISNQINIQNNNLKDELVEKVSLTVDSVVEEKLNNTINQIESNQSELKNHITEAISDTLNKTLNEKLSEVATTITSEIKSQIDERELEYQRKDLNQIDQLRNGMETMKKKMEEQEKENSKGFFEKLFKR